jgi:formylglycine-generating enzyme required for sulfatase activity
MGSEKYYQEEAPSHRVSVDGFWIDRTPVTNKQFRKFVNETGYVTSPKPRPTRKIILAHCRICSRVGSLVFTPPKHPVDLRDWSQWWKFKFGADWRRPCPRSSISGLDDHPVVHVSYRDAEAYAAWAGKERKRSGSLAARGGLIPKPDLHKRAAAT